MEQFVYHNIFETKGIEYIITIIFFILLVPFWLTLSRKNTQKQSQPECGTITADTLNIPQGLFYSQSHLWMHLEKSGYVKMGIDDFLQHITGEVEICSLKNTGSRVEKGEALFEIRQDKKTLMLNAPLSGTIEKINPELNTNPRIINSALYETGWIYQIRPENWKNDTAECYLSEDATKWMRNELEKFRNFISATVDKNRPEAGEGRYLNNNELIDHTLTSMPVEIWNDFQKEFLDG